MDFGLTEEQEAVRDLAEQIFQGSVTVERVKAIEASDERVDRDLWQSLADANLLGISLPEDVGGSGLGFTELTLVLEQQGRVVAPVPYWATVVCGALPIAEHGTPEQRQRWLPGVVRGEVFLASALAEIGVNDPLKPQATATWEDSGWVLDGRKVSVPAGHLADAILVPATTPDGVAVFLVDTTAAGVILETAVTTDRSKVAHVEFASTPAEPLGDVASGERITRWMLDRALLGLCATQIGVCEEAVRMAAEYTSQREQFGKPLSTFQGAQIRAADAYIDTEAIRVTTQQAAWKLDVGRDASTDVLVAKWWASEAGQHAVHMTQHLHGGMGADIDYPVHRYFLWGKQIEDTLGGATATLARLGAELTKTGA
ncbi:MAG: acyl-CoA/acyl-ACP dehydrogenase [Acidimicrobiia bacterium]|nr:acyl-CoA/acyl-ACP dehydrogenase [Acidimicrobiia bacterium]